MSGDRVTEINGEAFVRDLDSLIAERNALRNELGQWREAALKCTAAEGAMEAELEGARAKLAAVEAGMVVLNHWREALLDLHRKYPDKGFAGGAHALACVDAALHGSDDVGIGADEPAWQKFQAARAALHPNQEGHEHVWRRHQNVTSNGFKLPPYETCECGIARAVNQEEQS